MALTSAQQAAIKADILANPDLSAQPNNSDGAFEIARLYNLPASPTFLVWRTDAPTADIFDSINWSLYTPSDSPDNTATYTNRLLAIQTKQMNLQNMLVGRDTLNCAKANIRAGLRDAVIQIPAGAGGAMVSPGGVSGATVLAVCTRNATRLEKLLSTGSVTTGTTTAAVMGYEGQIDYYAVQQARDS